MQIHTPFVLSLSLLSLLCSIHYMRWKLCRRQEHALSRHLVYATHFKLNTQKTTNLSYCLLPYHQRARIYFVALLPFVLLFFFTFSQVGIADEEECVVTVLNFFPLARYCLCCGAENFHVVATRLFNKSAFSIVYKLSSAQKTVNHAFCFTYLLCVDLYVLISFDILIGCYTCCCTI